MRRLHCPRSIRLHTSCLLHTGYLIRRCGTAPCAAAAAGCPYIEGFSAVPDKDFPPGDRTFAGLAGPAGSVWQASFLCKWNTDCRGFSSSGWLQRAVAPTVDAFGVCLYTKDPASE